MLYAVTRAWLTITKDVKRGLCAWCMTYCNQGVARLKTNIMIGGNIGIWENCFGKCYGRSKMDLFWLISLNFINNNKTKILNEYNHSNLDLDARYKFCKNYINPQYSPWSAPVIPSVIYRLLKGLWKCLLQVGLSTLYSIAHTLLLVCI